jgi:thiol-disulfide isomerase/thioredoxin
MTEADVAPPERNMFRDLTLLVAVAILLNVGLVYFLRREPQATTMKPIPLPPVEAAGWINGKPPEKLSGKVVVVNVWATWCGYCRMDTPNLVKLHQKYKDRVTFIGLTGDGEESLGKIETYLADGGVTWPNGYGAVKTLHMLGVDAIPALFLVTPDGNIVAVASRAEGLEGALKQELAKL